MSQLRSNLLVDSLAITFNRYIVSTYRWSNDMPIIKKMYIYFLLLSGFRGKN